MESHPSFDLATFDVAAMMQLGAALRKVGTGATSMEEVANRVVREMNRSLVDATGAPACALVQLFATQPLDDLPAELHGLAATQCAAAGLAAAPDLRCLALLATAGVAPAWNSRHTTSGDRVIALTAPRALALAGTPILERIVDRLGFLGGGSRAFELFHVEDARGSPFLPDQAGFVEPFGVRSVLGLGGALRGGEVFAMILYSRVPIGPTVALLFEPLSLNLKVALERRRTPVFR